MTFGAIIFKYMEADHEVYLKLHVDHVIKGFKDENSACVDGKLILMVSWFWLFTNVSLLDFTANNVKIVDFSHFVYNNK